MLLGDKQRMCSGKALQHVEQGGHCESLHFGDRGELSDLCCVSPGTFWGCFCKTLALSPSAGSMNGAALCLHCLSCAASGGTANFGDSYGKPGPRHKVSLMWKYGIK